MKLSAIGTSALFLLSIQGTVADVLNTQATDLSNQNYANELIDHGACSPTSPTSCQHSQPAFDLIAPTSPTSSVIQQPRIPIWSPEHPPATLIDSPVKLDWQPLPMILS